jgi:glucosylceramidase
MARPDAAQVPALLAARRVNPALVLVASPWSAPGWMKDSGSLIRGHLRPDAYAPFADYLSRYLSEMDRRELPVAMLTVQNEPHFEPANYPGMLFAAADRARFDGQFLGPLLAARGQAVRILEWDHNWDRPQEPLAVLDDPQAARYVGGVAWHCYGGDVSAMAQVHAAHPDKDSFVTECSGGEWAPDWGGTLGWMIDNLVIAPTRYGSRGTALWNLALDEAHGPHFGGCGDCRAVVTIDRKTGAVTRNVEYYVLGQASRFVLPGARHIESDETADLANVAFRNPDGSLVLLVHNRGPARLAFLVQAGDSAFRAELPAGEVATYLWNGDPKGK